MPLVGEGWPTGGIAKNPCFVEESRATEKLNSTGNGGNFTRLRGTIRGQHPRGGASRLGCCVAWLEADRRPARGSPSDLQWPLGAGQPPLAGQLATRGIIAGPADLVHEAHCLQNTRGGKGFLPIGQQRCVGRWISCNK